MLTVLGILLLVAGAILTFAVDRQADGVDLQAVGWILIGGGGLSLLAAAIRAAGFARSVSPRSVVAHSERRLPDAGVRDDGHLGAQRPQTVDEQRVA